MRSRAGDAPSPGSAAEAARRLRPLNEPRRIRVETDPGGTPLAVVLGRRRRRVEAVQETWRIDDEWWRWPLSRLYHLVVLENGRTATLYQDRLEGGWYLQG